MRKTLLKVLTLVLIACVSVGMFTACGGGGDDGHTHTFSEEWSRDDTYHWHEATCGHTDQVSQKAAHSFGEIIIDQAPTPIKKGHGHKTCAGCTLTIYNIEVEYTYDVNADATLLFDVRGGKPIDPITVKAGTTVDLTDYVPERTDGKDPTFEGWVVGGNLVESIVVTGDMVAHASYACDEYMGKYTVYLGKYPQKVVNDATVIAALEEMEISDRNANGYYEYQGEEYAKEVCTFDSNLGFEKYKTYYFKVEPISWTNVGGVWTTLQVIDFVDETNYGESILEYLNGDFYNTLTEKEKEFIKDTKLNAEQPYKFYLWNVDTFASNHQSSSDKKLSLTDYALFRDDTSFSKQDRFTTHYWLLNPVNNSGVDTINHYTFNGNNWSTDAAYMDRAGLRPCFGFDFQGVKSKTSDETIRVTYVTNGGDELAPQAFIKDAKSELSVPTREGYDFAGWYKDAELKQMIGVSNFTSNKDLTLYAKWTEKPVEPDVYTITYNLNGGAFNSGATVVYEYLEETPVSFLTPKKDSTVSYNYTFDGWYLEETFVTKVTSTEGLAEDINLYAKWKETGIYFYIEYNLSRWDSMVESSYPTKVLRAEGTINLPTAQTSGSKFLGWRIDERGDVITTLSTLRTGTVRLYPYWVRAYNLTWNLNGGTLENEELLPDMIYANAPTIDFMQLVPQKDGYKFLYWSVSWLSSSSSKYGAGYGATLSFTEGANLPTTSSDPVITAVFGEAYTLNINLNGGNIDGNTETVELVFARNEGEITFTSPVKDGATLIGWARYEGSNTVATYYDMNWYRDMPYFTVNEDGTTTFTASKLFGYDSSTGTNSLYEFNTIYAIWG